MIVGSGLLGASLGLRLVGSGIDVYLHDTSPTSLNLACDIGAGQKLECLSDKTQVTTVIVAAPPDVCGQCVIEALNTYPNATVTDVASVKLDIAQEVLAADVDHSRYVGSHPMAGREQSGAGKADADLFDSRPWVIVPTRASSRTAVLNVRTLAVDVGATPVEFDAALHDRSVALISHVPQLISSLLAARLANAPAEALTLSGQGLRDTTRIAHSDPRLWTSIIAANRREISRVLRDFSDDLTHVADALSADSTDAIPAGVMGAVHDAIARGNDGVERIPGKHGGAQQHYAAVDVLIPDKPGYLGKLFSDVGQIGVNVEDFQMEHSRHGKQGIGTIYVENRLTDTLEKGLEERGWSLVVWENDQSR